MFIINSVYFSDAFSSEAEFENYKASFFIWMSDVTNQQNVHKLFRYIAMFDELVDHSKCCGFVHAIQQKVETIEEKVENVEEKTEKKIDEIGLKIIEAVTKPKRGRKAVTKKT